MSKADTATLDSLTGEFHTVALRESRLSTWAIIAIFTGVVAWASVATMTETVRGQGKIIPSSRMQTIQFLEGGILESLFVNEGSVVEEGDLLAKISDTKARSEFLEMASEAAILEAEVQRLEAEVTQSENLVFSDAADDEKAAREAALFNARRQTLDAKIAAAQAEYDAIQGQIAIVEPLTRVASVSKIDLLQLQQQLAAKAGIIEDVRNAYVQDAYKDLVEKKARLEILRQSMVQKQDQLNRTEIRSRMSGQVNAIHITTLGGVVQPGEPIMEVSPLGDKLVVETLIAPSDVAKVAPGQAASVKVTAYDYSVYGDIPGVVSSISADTVDSPNPEDKTPYYRVVIETERNHLERNGAEFPMKTGMVAEVDIKGEDRTILNYIIRPLIKARLQ